MAAVGQDLPGQDQGQDGDQGNGKAVFDASKWRKREVWSGWASVFVQGLVALAALGAVIIAIRATDAARDAVDTASEGIERQTSEDRLSTAIAAIGGDQAAERVGGFSLLSRYVTDQLDVANGDDGDAEDRVEAYSLYTVALDVLENYLRSPPSPPTESGEVAAEGTPARRGYGIPQIPSDTQYAANELEAMMELKADVQDLGLESASPSVDLSEAQLYGKSWDDIDFAWLGDGHNFPGIDLRGANLEDSIWGTTPDEGSNLTKAFLQCANLVDAKLIGTTLINADLRGADLSGADLTGADLTGIKLHGATWSNTTKGLEQFTQEEDVSRGAVGPEECLKHKDYWVQSKD